MSNPAQREVSVDDTVKNPPTPLELAEKRYFKEQGDVTSTLNSINDTLEGVVNKEKKIKTASTPALKKKYQKQVKDSERYLNQLFETLRLEMKEAAAARVELEKLGG